MGAVVEGDIGADDWSKYKEQANTEYGQAGDLDKNTLHVGTRLAFALEDGKQSASLDKLCFAILDVANTVPQMNGE